LRRHSENRAYSSYALASKILACLDLPARAPPLLPAQAAAVSVAGDCPDDDFDQTPAFADPW
jgi:hypothetical protein